MSFKHRKEALTELVERYRANFSHHWEHRHEFKEKLLTAHEAEFLPAALSLQEKPVSPAARFFAKVIMALVVVLLVWSIFGKVDIVVNATGKIIPSGNSKSVASVDVAKVLALHVREGQQVKAGDVLIDLDSSTSDAERDKAVGDYTMSVLQKESAHALINAVDKGMPPQLPPIHDVPAAQWLAEKQHLEAQYSDFTAKLKRLDGEIAHYAEELKLATKRASDYKELSLNHDVSEHAWMEKEQARITLAGQIVDGNNQRAAMITEATRTAHEQLLSGSKSAAASQQDALKANSFSKMKKLTSSVDGTVQQLNAHTVGGVVAAATPIMLIVPHGAQVEIEAFLENKDVGFVIEGQSVAIKIDAYDFTKYGTIAGKVIHVSRDAVADEKKGLLYSTRIMLEKSTIDVGGKKMNLSPGMSVNVEIRTGERRIIEYILSPLVRHKRESLNER